MFFLAKEYYISIVKIPHKSESDISSEPSKPKCYIFEWKIHIVNLIDTFLPI